MLPTQSETYIRTYVHSGCWTMWGFFSMLCQDNFSFPSISPGVKRTGEKDASDQSWLCIRLDMNIIQFDFLSRACHSLPIRKTIPSPQILSHFSCNFLKASCGFLKTSQLGPSTYIYYWVENRQATGEKLTEKRTGWRTQTYAFSIGFFEIVFLLVTSQFG